MFTVMLCESDSWLTPLLKESMDKFDVLFLCLFFDADGVMFFVSLYSTEKDFWLALVFSFYSGSFSLFPAPHIAEQSLLNSCIFYS